MNSVTDNAERHRITLLFSVNISYWRQKIVSKFCNTSCILRPSTYKYLFVYKLLTQRYEIAW